ncbi:MAG: hypothetical protein AB8C95_15550 [Phycisphaeraceae bacterium]
MADVLVVDQYAFAWDLKSNSGLVAIRGENGELVKRPISNAAEMLVVKDMLSSQRVVLRDNNLLVTGFTELIE